MSTFSPGWAYETEHPYAQYYNGNTYPGNSVMATVAGPKQDKKLYGTGGAVVLALAAYMLTRKMKKSQRAMKYGSIVGAGVLGYFVGSSMVKMPAPTDWSAWAAAQAKPQQQQSQPVKPQQQQSQPVNWGQAMPTRLTPTYQK